ncbi:MAG: AI-2E family transporter [Dehalococcoidia bacterium]
MSDLTRQRLRMAMIGAAMLFILWLLWAARAAFLPFLVGAVLAYMIAPLVDFLVLVYPLNKLPLTTARGVSILLVYAVAGGILAAIAIFAGPALADELSEFIDTLPDRVDQVTDWYEREVSADVREKIEDYAGDASDGAGDYLGDLARNSFSFLLSTVSIILGFILVPFWLFYVLKDQRENSESFYRLFPPDIRQDARNCVAIVNRIAGDYIRARLLEGLFIGITTTVGLYFLGIQGAVPLGVIAGITELIPFAGPVIGAIPALLVAITTEDLKTTIFVLIFFVALQQFESAVLVPNIEGKAVNTHPALLIVIVVAAGQIWGFVGILLAVPVSAILRDVFKYIYRRLDGLPADVVFRQIIENSPRGPDDEGILAPKELRKQVEDEEPEVPVEGPEALTEEEAGT